MNVDSVFATSLIIGAFLSGIFFGSWEGGLALAFLIALIYGVFID
jgi:hypothetical protein